MPPRTPIDIRFWPKVDKVAGGCWVWTGACHRGGYGQFHANGVTKAAHRVSWEIANGPPPTGLYVCHSCDNRPCVNPSHLFLGTAADNNRDRVAKGRWRGGQKPGTRNSHAKLNDQQLQELRSLLQSKSTKELADQFDISVSGVRNIATGKTYKQVGGTT